MKTRILANLALAAGLVLWPSQVVAAEHPWDKAEALLQTVSQDFQSSGFEGLKPHTAEMEQALAEAGPAVIPDAKPGGPVYVLTDGQMDVITAMAAIGAMTGKDPALKDREVVAVNNPYPALALALGSYYNEIGRFDEAVRVLGKGMTLYAVPDLGMGMHMPLIATEHALALARLGKLAEALAAYDDALSLAAAEDMDKARMQRGRGYVLTEMGKLDEAQAAYEESLKLEPGNKIALNELEYIKQLRAGGEKAPTEIVAPGSKPVEKPPEK